MRDFPDCRYSALEELHAKGAFRGAFGLRDLGFTLGPDVVADVHPFVAKALRLARVVLAAIWGALVWYVTVGLRLVWVAMFTTTAATGVLLLMFPAYSRDIVLTLAGFFVSGLVYGRFIGGGGGLGQIPATGTHARAHGYLHLAIWFGILLSGLAGSAVGGFVYDTFVAPHSGNVLASLAVGGAFSVLITLDLKLTWLASGR